MTRRVVITLLAGLVSVSTAWAGGFPKKGAPVPRFTLPDLRQLPTPLSDYDGRVVLLNFWASWCGPCLAEVPDLVRLQAALPVTQFTVVGIAQDEDMDELNAFLKQTPVNFPVLTDTTGRVAELYGVHVMPVTFLVDTKGKLVERVMGPREWSSPAWIGKIKGLTAR